MENETKKTPIYKKWWFWVIIVVLVLAIGLGANDNSQPTSSDSTSNISNVSSNTETKPIEYTKINTDELDRALEKNAAAAKDTYYNQYLEVTGRLVNIDSDLKYISLYSLSDEYDLVGMNCYIKSNEQREIVKTLSNDDIITVKGKVTGVGEVLGYSLDITEIIK